MKSPPGSRRRAKPITRPDGNGTHALAAIVGHELNNIGVPLDGYAEIAMQSLAPDSPTRQFIEEMQVGIARLQTLAHQLESLGECESNPVKVAIGDCMPDSPVEWLCESGTVVKVDPLHARRAVDGLLTTAWKAPLTVSKNLPRDALCAACSSKLSQARGGVRVEASNAHPVVDAALKDPFGPAGVGRTGQRLTLALLVHCAHHAGGHLLLDKHSGALSITFSLA